MKQELYKTLVASDLITSRIDVITNTISYVYQLGKEVTAKYMDFDCCVQELKTTHADGKYHSFHQVKDHKKYHQCVLQSLTKIKTSSMEGNRCVKVHYLLKIELPNTM